MESFTDKAKRLVQEAGLSYRQVGQKMGYDGEFARQAVYRFLNGKNPSAAMLKKFAEAVEVDVGELM